MKSPQREQEPDGTRTNLSCTVGGRDAEFIKDERESHERLPRINLARTKVSLQHLSGLAPFSLHIFLSNTLTNSSQQIGQYLILIISRSSVSLLSPLKTCCSNEVISPGIAPFANSSVSATCSFPLVFSFFSSRI